MIARQNDPVEGAQFQMIADLAAHQLLKRAMAQLKPLEYRLLSHYVMNYGVGSMIVESIRETAKACGISVAKVREARWALVSADFIQLDVFDIADYRNGQTPVVTVKRVEQCVSNSAHPVQEMTYTTEQVVEFLRSTFPEAVQKIAQGGVSNSIGKRVKDSRDKDKDISASNAALAPDAQASPSGRPRDPWYDFIFNTWGYAGSLNGEMRKMLEGHSTNPAFRAGNLPEHIRLTPEDGLEWAAWYRQTALRGDASLNMLEDRLKIASSIEQWYVLGKPKAASTAPTFRDGSGHELPNGPMSKVLAGLNIPNLHRTVQQ